MYVFLTLSYESNLLALHIESALQGSFLPLLQIANHTEP